MIGSRKSNERKRLEEVLARAVEGLRAADGPPESLSASARGRIVDAVLDPSHDPAAPASLFVPARRLALAGVLPAMLGVAFVLLLGHAGITRVPRKAHVVVEKRGDEVIFNVGNGGKSHYICKSSVPDRFDCDRGVRVRNGAYADPVRDGSDIVFYRID